MVFASKLTITTILMVIIGVIIIQIGVQELIVNCVRDEDQKVVSPYLCSRTPQPEVVTQTCNDHPCPPRWNVSEYQTCSKTCGMGIQTREVNCIHEVTISNTVFVPSHMCEQPPPPDRQYCNFIDCPIEWHVTNWTKCSKQCDGGEKKRQVQCRQITAQNHVIPQPEHLCPSPKPPTTRLCNSKPCTALTKQPVILFDDDQNYDQEKDARGLEVSLKIGGQASVFAGTTVVIKCPVKKFNKGKIKWMKDGMPLTNSDNYRINRRGKLKISEATYDDAGLFSCTAGQSTGRIRITVKPRLSGFPPSSEEIDKKPAALDPETMKYSGQFVEIHETDISHETVGNPPKKVNSRKKEIVTSTSIAQLPYQSSTENIRNDKENNQLQVADSFSPPTSAASRTMPGFFSFFTNLKSSWFFQDPYKRQRTDRALTEEQVQVQEIELSQQFQNEESHRSPAFTDENHDLNTTILLNNTDYNNYNYNGTIK